MLFLVLPIVFAQNSLYNISQTLRQNWFIGRWDSEPNAFNFLEGIEGTSRMHFWVNSTEEIYSISMEFLDPAYYDEKYILFGFHLDNYNQTEQSWNGTTQTTTKNFRNSGELSQSQNCSLSYVLVVSMNQSLPKLDVKLNSTDCDINLRVTYEIDQTNYHVLLYCLLMTFVNYIRFSTSIKLFDERSKNRTKSDAFRISTYTQAYLTIQDIYLYLLTANYAFTQEECLPFLLPLLLYASMGQQNLELLRVLWKFQFRDYLEGDCDFRMSCHILKYIIYILVFIYTMHNLEFNNYFTLATSLFMVPQILHNIYHDQNPKCIVEYIFGILVINMVRPVNLFLQIKLYFKIGINTFERLAPSLWFSICWILSFSIQIGILLLQHKNGPRSIIPQCFLPKHKYYGVFSYNEECPICLDTLSDEPDEKLFVTFCKHKFHIVCLKRWTNVQQKCPICSRITPPIN